MKEKRTISELRSPDQMAYDVAAGVAAGMLDSDDDVAPDGKDNLQDDINDVEHDHLDDEEEHDHLDGELGDGDEEEECVNCNKEELRELLDSVEMGDMPAEEAFEKLCGMEDDLGDMEDDLDSMEDDLGGMEDNMEGNMEGGEGGEGEYMESVDRIAKMLTDDPDIING